MATTVAKLSMTISWWVRPYIWIAYVAVIPFKHAVDIDAYAVTVSAFATKHGLHMKIG